MPPWQPRIIKKLQKEYEVQDMHELYGKDTKAISSDGRRCREHSIGITRNHIILNKDTIGREATLVGSQGKEAILDEGQSRPLNLGQSRSDRAACVQEFSKSTRSNFSLNAGEQAVFNLNSRSQHFDLNEHDSSCMFPGKDSELMYYEVNNVEQWPSLSDEGNSLTDHMQFKTCTNADYENGRMPGMHLNKDKFYSFHDQSDTRAICVDLNLPALQVKVNQEHQRTCIPSYSGKNVSDLPSPQKQHSHLHHLSISGNGAENNSILQDETDPNHDFLLDESYGLYPGNDIGGYPNTSEGHQPRTGIEETKFFNGLNVPFMPCPDINIGKVESGRSDTSSNNFFQNDDHLETQYGSAVWDIFRRQDVPKLTEYLKKHHREFRHINGLPVNSVIHPIHDQILYLNEKHKKQLKLEFGVEPWTFEQHLGEAVFVPAGCPHQVRNRKSCIKVALDFVSPENVQECIRLTEEFRLLPKNHRSKEDKLEIKKMAVYAADVAIAEATKLMGGN
ncbi:hypothetical protein VNO77_30692 [Canavalia gladiata]|uniref:JmjC domain-containing protein n=1 Tax=Canavalia gladiata TaxID=3824 RepID=A0AAN9KS35_CANGL